MTTFAVKYYYTIHVQEQVNSHVRVNLKVVFSTSLMKSKQTPRAGVVTSLVQHLHSKHALK